MTNEDFIDAESLGVTPEITINGLHKVQWRTKERELIYLKDMEDSHLRNTAMFLAGFGYQKCVIPDHVKLLWLKVLKLEWDRRMQLKISGNRTWNVRMDDVRKSRLLS